jgi:anthranilate/para-aminobenzoate synthase component I
VSVKRVQVASEYRLEPEVLNGAAFGYISYDCVRYFEPRVDQYDQPNSLQLPVRMHCPHCAI